MQVHWGLPHSVAEVPDWAPVRIVFLLLVAVIVRAILHKMINVALRRMIRVSAPGPLQALASERREQRLSALGSMAQAVITVIVAFVVVMMILTELGFNVTTIVAGTSVLGVAIAFGVQSIVKDFLSGIFMLFEDQLGVGDYVDMDKASGTVEAVSLRITQLRDDNGNLWYVRNGEVVRVGNFSKGGSDRPVTAEVGAWTLSYSPAKEPKTDAVRPPQPAEGAEAKEHPEES